MPDALEDLKARQEAARRARAHNPDTNSTAHLQAAAIANCRLCDDDGYHGTRVCDHVDYAAAAKRGITKVREALTKPRKSRPLCNDPRKD